MWYWGKIRFLKWGSDPNLRNTPNWDMVMRQIERVRQATYLLTHEFTITEVAHALGYYDQAHMTRSLNRFVGLTPGQIAAGRQQLSLLYNTLEPEDRPVHVGRAGIAQAEAVGCDPRKWMPGKFGLREVRGAQTSSSCRP